MHEIPDRVWPPDHLAVFDAGLERLRAEEKGKKPESMLEADRIVARSTIDLVREAVVGDHCRYRREQAHGRRHQRHLFREHGSAIQLHQLQGAAGLMQGGDTLFDLLPVIRVIHIRFQRMPRPVDQRFQLRSYPLQSAVILDIPHIRSLAPVR